MKRGRQSEGVAAEWSTVKAVQLRSFRQAAMVARPRSMNRGGSDGQITVRQGMSR